MSPAADPADAFAAAVAGQPSRTLVAVDVDGTLAPIVARPEDSTAVDGAAAALRALAGAGVRVALLTGRPAADAVAIVGLRDDDDVVVLGHYGLQRWQAGRLDSPDEHPGVAQVRAALPALLVEAPEGVHVEDKEHSLVVHTRPAADPAAALAGMRPRLEELAEQAGLELLPGRAVLELRPPGIDKGGAIRTLLEDGVAAAYIGDDVADLDAFAALRQWAAEGTRAGVSRTVLTVASDDPAVTDSDPRVVEAADLVLPGPAAVVAWLTALHQRVVSGSAGQSTPQR